jgi:hypothetical protein
MHSIFVTYRVNLSDIFAAGCSSSLNSLHRGVCGHCFFSALADVLVRGSTIEW